MSPVCRAILLVDDDANLLEGIKRKLRRRYDIVTATSGHAGLEILRQHGPFAVIVADYKMPGMDGVTFLRAARTISPGAVAVMLTGQAQLDVAISALHEGNIYRFLTKPCADELLDSTLEDCLEHHRLVIREKTLIAELNHSHAELAKRNKELEWTLELLSKMNLRLEKACRIDSLTELLNRRAWVEAASIEQERAGRQGLMLGIIMLDVDAFKRYNDLLGHQCGDQCLQALARCVQGACRTVDVVGRYGGEEFIIACVSCDAAGVHCIAERVREAVWNLDIPHPDNPAATRVTVSVGSAVGISESWEQLAAKADKALYAAKQAGRNRLCDMTELPEYRGCELAVKDEVNVDRE